MANKRVYEVQVVGLSPTNDAEDRTVYVIAPNPASANNKVVKHLGDSLLFIGSITLKGSNNENDIRTGGCNQLI